MTQERPQFNGSFEYSPRVTPTQNFPEVTVTIGFRIGLKPVQSFAGHAHAIQNDDQQAMEAASFYEAAKKAWTTKYGTTGIDNDTATYVKETIEAKWTELNRGNKTPKKLKFLTPGNF